MVSRYKLVAMKLVSPSKEHLEKHYEDLAGKPFYKGLVTCELIPISRYHAGASTLTLTVFRHAEWPHLCHGLGRP